MEHHELISCLALPHALRWNTGRDLAHATPQLSDKCSGFIIPLSSLRPVQACGWSLRHKAGSCGWAEPVWVSFLAKLCIVPHWYHMVPSTVLLCTFPIFWCHFQTSTFPRFLVPRVQGSVDSEKFPMGLPWPGSHLFFSQPHQTWSNMQEKYTLQLSVAPGMSHEASNFSRKNFQAATSKTR